MIPYIDPSKRLSAAAKKKHVWLVANGDLRLSANQNCWAAQEAMEHALAESVAAAGYELVRAHPYKKKEKHKNLQNSNIGFEQKIKLLLSELVFYSTPFYPLSL